MRPRSASRAARKRASLLGSLCRNAPGQAAPCIRAACPGSTWDGGAMSCCQRRRGSALCAARCAGQGRRRRRTACSDLRPARRRAGVTPVQCPVLRAFVPCLPPTGCDAFGTALRSEPGPPELRGLCSRVPAARRRCGRAACPALPAGSSPETHGHRRAG